MRKRAGILIIFFGFVLTTCFAENEQIDSLKKILSSAHDDTARVNTLLALGKKLFSTSPVESVKYGIEAKKLAEQLNYRKGLAYAYKTIGMGYYWQGNHVEAIHNYQKSLAIFDSIGDKVGVANIQNNIGAVYSDETDDATALLYYLKSLKNSEEVGDTLRIATACVNIGLVYADKKQTYDTALTYLKRALPLSIAIGDDQNTGNACVNIGDVYFKEGDDTAALAYYNRSLKAFANSENMPYSLNAIGNVYLKRKDYKLALKYHQMAYDAANKSGAKLDMAQSFLGIASAQQQDGNIAQSISTYKQAEVIADSLHANEQLKEAYEGLASAYSSRSDFSNAFKYQNLLTAIKDTLYNIDVDKKLQGLPVYFRPRKKGIPDKPAYKR